MGDEVIMHILGIIGIQLLVTYVFYSYKILPTNFCNCTTDI